MAKLEKTSEAVYRSVRINPKTSKEDFDMLAIILELEKDGYTFKQIAQDAILRAGGKTPEMYSKNTGFYILDSIEEMLGRFATEVVTSLKGNGKRVLDEDIDSDEDVSPFAKRMAKSFMQRQKSKGDE